MSRNANKKGVIIYIKDKELQEFTLFICLFYVSLCKMWMF